MSSKNFKEISREIWQEMRQGTPFEQPKVEVGDYTADFYGLQQDEDIDYDALADFIFDCEHDHRLVFYWGKFAKTPNKEWVKVKTGDGMQDRLETIHNTIPFSYTNENKVVVQTQIKGKINRRIDYLEDYWAYYIDINPQKETIDATIKILYDNTKKFIVDAKDTIDKGDFRIDEKYIAIVLSSTNLIDFCYLIKDTVGSQYVADLKKLIAKKYCNKIKQCKVSSELDFLYENAPDFVLNQLVNYMDWNEIFNHLLLLTNRDDNITFSSFIDTSNALINCMKAIGNGEFLFLKFYDNPALVKRIFYNLDGSSLVEGVSVSNKIIFSSFLSILGKLYATDKSIKGSFKINGGYKIGANALFEDDEETKNNTFFLDQEKENIELVVLPSGSILPIEYDTDENDGGYYSPFDFVELIEYVGDKTNFSVTCAIYAKAISHEDEVVEIQFATRIGLDVLAIIIGVATLGTGTGFALALVEMGFATTDIIVAIKEDELMKTEEGQAFLSAYNGILLVGAAFAAPELLTSVFKNGSKLLKIASATNKAKIVNFIRASFLRLILEAEIANFTKGTVKILEQNTEIVIATGGLLNEFKINKFFENGIVLVSGEVQTANKVEEQLALIYKGEAIIQGNKNNFKEAARKLVNTTHNEKKLLELCEELWRRIPKIEGKFWTCFNEAGTELKWFNQKGANGVLRSEKSTGDFINALKNSSKDSDKWVGEVADELRKYDELTDVNNNVLINLGDFDVASKQFLIECKESLSYSSINKKVIDQFDKYINPLNENYVNVSNKKVVLAIGKNDGKVLSHPFIKELQQKHNVQIITNSSQIKNLK